MRPCCAIGLLGRPVSGGRCPSLADYVTVRGATRGAIAPEGANVAFALITIARNTHPGSHPLLPTESVFASLEPAGGPSLSPVPIRAGGPDSRLIEALHIPQVGPEEALNVRTNLAEVV
jgi:hypothetical protein